MFKPHHSICVQCNQPAIVVVKAMLCGRCNHENKQAKKKLAGKSIAKYSYVKEPTGEKQLFEEIAEEREWVCFVTGETLWELTPTQFIHVLPKALNKFPKYKLYKGNIVLGSNEVHHKWDHTPHSELKKDPRFDKLFALEAELKKQYPFIPSKKSDRKLGDENNHK